MIPNKEPVPNQTEEGRGEQEPAPERTFDPGELAPHWDSPYPNVLEDLSEGAKKELLALANIVGEKDIAARRWEVQQAWEARLFYRGYQYLIPRKGGGWVLPPFASSYDSGTGAGPKSRKFYGYETNMYTTYGEIVQAALTRDVPKVRFEPQNPESDADITAAQAASDYARVFMRTTDLKKVHEQIANYLWTDGRVMLITDHVKDSQKLGREDPDEEIDAVPETMGQDKPILFLVRHGETAKNLDGETRGRSEVGLDSTGEREILRAAEWLKDQGIQAIISSPVDRARESAEGIAQTLGIPVEIDDRAASLDIGTEWTGQKTEVIAPQVREAFETPDQPIGGDGETPQQFTERVQQALFTALQSGQLAAIVTHDSFIGQAFKILHGSDQPGGSLVDPGGVAGVYQNSDGTLRIEAVFPYQRPTASTGIARGAPRGAEQVAVGGKLEGRCPVNARDISDMPFVLFAQEYDLAQAKGMFPDHADKIREGGASTGENQLDRIARINCALALEASYVTGDSMVRDCTVQRYWFRPSFFLECKKHEIREELLDKFPDGCHLILAGGEATPVLARNESMDDHVTIIQAGPGTGQNRIPLGGKMISLQKRGNNWVDLMNAFLIKTVPMKWLPRGLVDDEAVADQGNEPGALGFYQPTEVPSGQTFQSMLAVEPAIQPQTMMITAIEMFFEKFGQLFSHALPSLFGSNANTDTVGGIAIQRDQALGCLGSPWHAIQMACCNYFKQAVQLAAQCRSKPIVGSVQGNKIRVELSDLKGQVTAYPEQDANFPETWSQIQTRYQTILQDSSNPLVQKLLGRAKNLRIAKDAIGIEKFDVPEADAYDKQLGEFDVLLRTEPLPNPQKAQMIQQAEQLAAKAMQTGDLQAEQQAAQMMQQAQGMPDQVSSVAVDPEVDFNDAEAEACRDWLNSPDGRKFKNGTQKQRMAWMNVRLHMTEHKALIQPPSDMKPPSWSVNFKDLPPDAAAKILENAGLEEAPAGGKVLQTREFGAMLKKSGKIGGPPVPGT